MQILWDPDKQLSRLGLMCFCYQIYPALFFEMLDFHVCLLPLWLCSSSILWGADTVFSLLQLSLVVQVRKSLNIVPGNTCFIALVSRLSEGQGSFVYVTSCSVVDTCPYSANIKYISLMLISNYLRVKFAVCLQGWVMWMLMVINMTV